jgi:hypothetical protein
VDVDAPRLLHRRSQFGYTRSVHEGLRDEPEAVDASTQARLTELAHGREQERRRADWLEARRQLVAVLDWLGSRPLGLELRDEVRGIRRVLDRADRRLQTGRPGS